MADLPAPSADFRHSLPGEIAALIASDPLFGERWHGLTDLGRNEWICWMTSAKKQETRDARQARLLDDVRAGKKRPCCWPGCPHRSAAARKWVSA